MYKCFFKRFFDVCFSLIALILLSPLLLVVTLWLALANKGSLPHPLQREGRKIYNWQYGRRGLSAAFFLQNRPGKDGKIFKIIKFKTMTDERDAEGYLLPDADRLTKVGKFVRSTSIDELPQLINVLKGDMSLIGPRPLLVQYLPLYSKEQARRQEVRPGITGWAQCHGRNAISWTEKFKLDVWYVDHLSFGTDLKIIGLTFMKVLQRADINEAGQATMEFFDGTN
jgi:lipopolysaccharide/colanic/teichoic acid biosynthesis glycosyltransferase